MREEFDGKIVFNNSLLDPDRDMWHEMLNAKRIWYWDDPELRAITETTQRKRQIYESD